MTGMERYLQEPRGPWSRTEVPLSKVSSKSKASGRWRKKILDKVEASQRTVIPYVLLLPWTVFLESDIRGLAQLSVPLPSC